MYSVDDFNVIAYIWHLPELIYNSCDLPSKPQNTSIFYNHYNDPVGKVKHFPLIAQNGFESIAFVLKIGFLFPPLII